MVSELICFNFTFNKWKFVYVFFHFWVDCPGWYDNKTTWYHDGKWKFFFRRIRSFGPIVRLLKWKIIRKMPLIFQNFIRNKIYDRFVISYLCNTINLWPTKMFSLYLLFIFFQTILIEIEMFWLQSTIHMRYMENMIVNWNR